MLYFCGLLNCIMPVHLKPGCNVTGFADFKLLFMRCNMIIYGMFLFTNLAAQKQVAAVPFEFSSRTPKDKFEIYYLTGKKDESFSLVLKDYKKVSYILFDRNFKQV